MIQTLRRNTLRTLLHLGAAALLTGLIGPAGAQDRPIEWVVGYPAGGGSDMVARTLAEPMAQLLKRPVIINNRPGAATNIAADYVARSKDPGSILFTADFATLAANPSLFAKLPYDPDRDFTPVGLLARFPMLLVVSNDVPARNWMEFAAWARAQPQGVNYASAGLGSPHHLSTELLRQMTGLKLTHVPYRGAAPAVQDLLGGQIKMGLMDTASVQQHVIAGRLRAIGVASAERLKNFPDVPTLIEQGVKGYEAYAWQGLVVPSSTPKETVAQLHKALQAALDTTLVKARFHTLSLEALPGTPEQMTAYVTAERERWGKLIRENGFKIE
jgi:tripartite-type tricarboxylate transporter receptor subunit TctC